MGGQVVEVWGRQAGRQVWHTQKGEGGKECLTACKEVTGNRGAGRDSQGGERSCMCGAPTQSSAEV